MTTPLNGLAKADATADKASSAKPASMQPPKRAGGRLSARRYRATVMGRSQPKAAKPTQGQACRRVVEGGRTLNPSIKAQTKRASGADRERTRGVGRGVIEVMADDTLGRIVHDP